MTPVDVDAVARWMDEQGLGTGSLGDVQPISGGTQNVMVRFTRDGREYVLRRGPEHLRTGSNKVILRETAVLGALADTDVPHPHLIAACEDEDVLGGAVFYLMEPVDGFNASVELPDRLDDPDDVRAMAFSQVDALARLGAVDHRAVGLEEFGRPDGFLERQVDRWLSELDGYRSEDFEPDIPGVDEVAQWLRDHLPADWAPGIMHGDYHAANVMFARDRPEVAAIVDWEMSTIGDPLLDLGWLLGTWRLPDVEGVFAGPYMAAHGLPAAADLRKRYAGQTDRDLTHLRWYIVLACFKLGIVLEGTWARAQAGEAPMDVGEQLHTTTLRLFARAQELIDTEEPT